MDTTANGQETGSGLYSPTPYDDAFRTMESECDDLLIPLTLPSAEQINCIFIWIHLEAVTYDCHQAIYALSHIYDPIFLADAGKIS